jgi:hypothetical protein
MYVGGCSGGGVLSSWVIGHTDRFAAAAVRCPVTNWMSFAGQTDVPFFTYNFFDKPFWEEPTRWLEQSPLMYVGRVTTPTLVMTGELDLRTPDAAERGVLLGAQVSRRAHRAAALRGRVPRHRLAPVELDAHAALHDELVRALAAGGRARGEHRHGRWRGQRAIDVGRAV